MTASDWVVGKIYEGGQGETRGKRRITEIQYGHVWYRPVPKCGEEGHFVRQDTAGFLRWCNQAERQETDDDESKCESCGCVATTFDNPDDYTPLCEACHAELAEDLSCHSPDCECGRCGHPACAQEQSGEAGEATNPQYASGFDWMNDEAVVRVAVPDLVISNGGYEEHSAGIWTDYFRYFIGDDWQEARHNPLVSKLESLHNPSYGKIVLAISDVQAIRREGELDGMRKALEAVQEFLCFNCRGGREGLVVRIPEKREWIKNHPPYFAHAVIGKAGRCNPCDAEKLLEEQSAILAMMEEVKS